MLLRSGFDLGGIVMSFVITSNDYVKYINNIAKRIYENRDYITN